MRYLVLQVQLGLREGSRIPSPAEIETAVEDAIRSAMDTTSCLSTDTIHEIIVNDISRPWRGDVER